jgi:hypothetical protein
MIQWRVAVQVGAAMCVLIFEKQTQSVFGGGKVQCNSEVVALFDYLYGREKSSKLSVRGNKFRINCLSGSDSPDSSQQW